MDSEVRKALLEELKKQGLDVAEDALGSVVKAVFAAADKAIEASTNKYDDMARPFLPMGEALLLKLVDKIDGEEG